VKLKAYQTFLIYEKIGIDIRVPVSPEEMKQTRPKLRSPLSKDLIWETK